MSWGRCSSPFRDAGSAGEKQLCHHPDVRRAGGKLAVMRVVTACATQAVAWALLSIVFTSVR